MQYEQSTVEFPARAASAEWIAGEVVSLIRAICGLGGVLIKPARPLTDYGMDSVRATELVVALESAFGVEISDEDAFSLRTLADICEYLERSLATRSGEWAAP